MSISPFDVDVLRYAAFTEDGSGGNPAGVVLDAGHLDAAAMQAIAAAVGYSETAFVRDRGPAGEHDVRYFTPEVEVPFCGHATIAAAVALAHRDGPAPLRFLVPAGEVTVDTDISADGTASATLTTVPPAVEDVPAAAVADAIAALRWSPSDLDRALPPRIASAGSRHLILAAATRERLARLDYDHDRLAAVMRHLELITVALIWREDETILYARNPAPLSGIPEDPATGSAAAAIGAYLVNLGEVRAPTTLLVRQGHDMGRPSRLVVEIDGSSAGVRVTGTAVRLA